MNEKLLTAIRASFPLSHSSRPVGTPDGAQPSSLAAIASLAKTLHVGDTVRATVTASWPEQQLARLRINSHELLASTHGLKLPGGQISLQVTAAGAKPEFHLLPAPPGIEQTRTEALKTFLPRQQSAAELASLLESYSKQDLAATPAINLATRQLMQSIPAFRQLTQPAELFRLIANSGLFFETRLLSGSPGKTTESGDFKARLLQLSQLLQQYVDNTAAPKKPRPGKLPDKGVGLMSLLQSTEGSLSSVIVNQLRSLPKADGSQAWVISLPYHENASTGLLKLEITEESGSDSKAEPLPPPRSSVNVDFTLSQLGRMQVTARISGNNLSVQIRCQYYDTMRQFVQHRDMLAEQLEQSGINPADMIISEGIIADDTRLSPEPLVNEKV